MTAVGPHWCVIAGGGTAGHVHPGLAIATALVDGGRSPESILFVGSDRGVDSDLVPSAGFELVTLPGRGIQRRLTVQNIGSVMGLLWAFAKAFRLLRRVRPAVVVSLGGYASVPCGLAAVLLRIPVVVAEQNAVPGAANRLVGRWAKAAAVSFPETDLPNAVYTGNPVRAEMLGIDREAGREAARRGLGVGEGRKLLCCYGGSLGAKSINEAVAGAAAAWASRGDISIHHVVGHRDWGTYSRMQPVSAAEPLEYRAVEYEDDMAAVLAGADLLVCRAGASTVAELTIAGAPAILVPLPGAPGDHQTANARALADSGGAVMITDQNLTEAALRREVDRLFSNPAAIDAISERCRKLGRPGAGAAVAGLVERHARG